MRLKEYHFLTFNIHTCLDRLCCRYLPFALCKVFWPIVNHLMKQEKSVRKKEKNSLVIILCAPRGKLAPYYGLALRPRTTASYNFPPFIWTTYSYLQREDWLRTQRLITVHWFRLKTSYDHLARKVRALIAERKEKCILRRVKREGG